MALELTERDHENLETLEQKLSVIRDAVRGVVRGYYPSVFLWGSGGTGKSFTVLNLLKKLNADYVLHNTRVTARGLADALRGRPTAVHLIEDAESLMDDRNAWNLLRSALWSQSKKRPPVRPISWVIGREPFEFRFTGGIIIISNVNLVKTRPELAALATRLYELEHDLTPGEITAQMKSICLKGYRSDREKMEPEECWDVGRYVYQKAKALGRPLDFRVLIHGFKSYLFYRDESDAENHWKTLIDGLLEKSVGAGSYRPRAAKSADKTQTARAIDALKIPLPEKLARWKTETGLEKSAYYRALGRS